jgi:hypothetical protein
MKLNRYRVRALPFDGNRQYLEDEDDSAIFVDGHRFGDHEIPLASIAETSEDGIPTEEEV